MTNLPTEWDRDLEIDPEEKERALMRTLHRTEGFDLLFVRCTPAEGQRLIAKARQTLPRRKIELLALEESIANLYDRVESLPNCDQIEILFISGIEKSLVDYIRPGYGGVGDYYNRDTVPAILGHLNLLREAFRKHFHFCFVFLVPLFALKYFIRRAPDFFDWNSGVFEFELDAEILQQEPARILEVTTDETYRNFTPQECSQKLLEIQDLIEAENQLLWRKLKLLIEQGDLLRVSKQYQAAIASYDKALEINSNLFNAWNSRGVILLVLKRYEEAIESYDKALEIRANEYITWYNRGLALNRLGHLEETIESYNEALKIQPNDYQAWYNRGIYLELVGQYKEAIESYDIALEMQPDDYQALVRRGAIVFKLNSHRKSLTSFSESLQDKDDYKTWDNRSYLLLNYLLLKKLSGFREPYSLSQFPSIWLDRYPWQPGQPRISGTSLTSAEKSHLEEKLPTNLPDAQLINSLQFMDLIECFHKKSQKEHSLNRQIPLSEILEEYIRQRLVGSGTVKRINSSRSIPFYALIQSSYSENDEEDRTSVMLEDTVRYFQLMQDWANNQPYTIRKLERLKIPPDNVDQAIDDLGKTIRSWANKYNTAGGQSTILQMIASPVDKFLPVDYMMSAEAGLQRST